MLLEKVALLPRPLYSRDAHNAKDERTRHSGHYLQALKRVAISFIADTPSSDNGNIPENMSHFISV